MADLSGSHFQGQTVVLDGNNYIDCRFEQCTIVYRAETLPELKNCNFHDCSFRFEGAADRTITFMKGIYHGLGQGGRDLITATFEGMKKG